MLLVIDVGNTNTVTALYEGACMRRSWRMDTNKNRASDEMGVLLLQFLSTEQVTADDISAVMIASVVPPVMHALTGAIRRYLNCEPVVVGPGIKTGMNIRCENPREVGADLIVSGVAAIHKYGAPLIVLDFGTATTFSVIDSNGDYLGNLIAPGLKISMDALFERAAKLPRIELKKPSSLIGKTTVSSLQAGAVFGHAAQVDGIVRRIKQESSMKNAQVIATGGLSGLIAAEAETVDVIDRMLTLDGLRIIYEKNR